MYESSPWQHLLYVVPSLFSCARCCLLAVFAVFSYFLPCQLLVGLLHTSLSFLCILLLFLFVLLRIISAIYFFITTLLGVRFSGLSTCI